MRQLFSVLVILLINLCAAFGQRTPGTVYVVHAIDTETRHLTAYPYSQVLDVSNFTDTGVAGKVMTDSFRSDFVDSYNGKIKFSWFFLTHEAYAHSQDNNALVVFDQMQKFSDQMSLYGDMVGWHFHNVDWIGSVQGDTSKGRWEQLKTFNGTQYQDGKDIALAEEKFAEIVLDRGFYPVAFRAGWDWEDNDFSKWLDDIIPFDFSSAAPLPTGMDTSDTAAGKDSYDWSRAPIDWSYYHPDTADYQRPGSMKRTIFRCLPGHHSSGLDYIRAFKRARDGENVIVCAYAHAIDDLIKFARISVSALKNAQQVFPSVNYRFVNAVDGARAVMGISDFKAPVLTVVLKNNMISVSSNELLYSYPFGAVKDEAGRYSRVLPVRTSPDVAKGRWNWTFDLTALSWSEFAAGACDPAGNGVVSKIIQNQK